MTHDDVIRFAKEAGWTGIYSEWISSTEKKHLTVPVTIEQIEAFAKLVAAEVKEALTEQHMDDIWQAIKIEREACAKLVESFGKYESDIADEIRARGQA